MQQLDYTNLEEAWDRCQIETPDPERLFEAIFYAGAIAALTLHRGGRSLSNLDAEIIDWLVCFAERTHGPN